MVAHARNQEPGRQEHESEDAVGYMMACFQNQSATEEAGQCIIVEERGATNNSPIQGNTGVCKCQETRENVHSKVCAYVEHGALPDPGHGR